MAYWDTNKDNDYADNEDRQAINYYCFDEHFTTGSESAPEESLVGAPFNTQTIANTNSNSRRS